MADGGLIIPVDFDTVKAEAKQRKLNREMENSKIKAENITKNIKELNSELEKEKNAQADIKDKLKAQLEESKQLEKHIENLKQGTASVADTMEFGGLNAANQKLTEIENSIKKTEQELEKSYNKQKGITKEINKQEFSLKQQNAKTADIGDKILLNTKKQNKFTKAFDKSQKSADRFGRRLKSLIASALFFSVVTKAFTALRNEFGKLITETDTKTAKLVAQLNGSLAVLGRTLYEGAKPYIEWILEKLIKMVNVLTYGLAKILGKNVNEMKKLAQQTKKTGEEAQKSTASFDTLQKADSSKSSGESGAGTDFGALNGKIDGEVALLMAILSGALLVLGVILAFTGTNIPLGIGLIIAGAVGLASSVVANWNDLPNNIQNIITIILGIVSVALLVLGAIFAFTGNIALGVGFLILGAVGLATTVAITMNKLPNDIKKTVSIIAAIVSGALLVLGIILLATGVASGLGLGLLVAGAAGLAGTLAANWNSMPEKTKNIISLIMGIGGLLMLVIGLILTCTGMFTLGIPLIIVGAVGLVSAVALNWNKIVEQIRGPIGKIMAIIGASLLVLGILLLFIPGVGWGLGFGLILAGAAALGTSIAFNWSTIVEKIKAIGKAIGNVFVKVWNGIKNGFKAMVNGIIWYANLWIKGLNALLTPVRALIVGISRAFGKEVSLKDIKIPSIPKLATGAVIPGGSPFLAMLGDQRKGQTNIEAPADLIRQIVREESGGKTFEVKATGSMAQLIRLLRLEIKEEDNRASVF